MQGFWRIGREGDTATLAIDPLERIPKSDAAALREEGARLLRFAASDAATQDIRFGSPG